MISPFFFLSFADHVVNQANLSSNRAWSLGTACTSVKPVICPHEQHCSTQTLSHPQKLECSCLSSMLMEALHACIMQIHMFYMNDDPEDKLNSLCRDN